MASSRRWRATGLLLLGALSGTVLALFPLEPFSRPVRPGTLAGRSAFPLRDGGFEEAAAWQTHDERSCWAEGEGRGRSRALRVEGETGRATGGAWQRIVLQPEAAHPLRVSGWSRAQAVDGAPGPDYSLYVDLEFEDGSFLHGQSAPFACGTHEWERREIVLPVARPVRALNVHCLFRRHRGTAWFDDIEVEERRPEPGAIVYQGAPLRMAEFRPRGLKNARAFATEDGLELSWERDAVASLRLDGRELAGAAASGFLVRDVQADSDLHRFQDGTCPELGLGLEAEFEAHPDHLAVRGRVRDLAGRDRAITLVFALPLDARGWRWGEDLRRARRIEGAGEYANVVPVPSGATGTMSRYPLAAIDSPSGGLALAVDMDWPAQYRLAYHGGARQFLVAYDFGLLRDSARAPGSAAFRFVLYRFEPAWGFRAALRKLYGIFPDHFAARAREHGLWLPFGRPGRIRQPEDFGFRYHEGSEDPAGDRALGILSFRYSEPMTWWMPLPPGTPRTEEEARRALEAAARREDGAGARAALASGMIREDGSPAVLFRSERWCDGAVWSLNPSPSLPGGQLVWNPGILERRYGPAAADPPDGEFLDSLEGYVTSDLDFRRENLRQAFAPLTFAGPVRRPAALKGLLAWELVRAMARDLRPRGKLLFGNGAPRRFSFLCGALDVLGMEVDWNPGGRYSPNPDEDLALWRSMAFQKPFHLLQNTDFDAFSPELVERYFRDSLFYGMFPSFFGPGRDGTSYWDSPDRYERDRPLFRRYVPLFRRLAVAGWQPVTEASCDNPAIQIERFGPDARGVVYLTVRNATDVPQAGTLRLEPALCRPEDALEVRELAEGRALEADGAALPVELGPHEVWMIEARCRDAAGR